MKKLNKLSLPATIIIASIILGGFIFATQIIKQQSIERQQEIKVDQERQDQLDKELKEQQAKEEAEQALGVCLDETVDYYNHQIEDYCKDYLIKENCGIPQKTVDIWLKNQRLLRDECFKRYPQQ